MIRRLLSGVPFVLLCLSPDQGGGGGGSSTESAAGAASHPAEPTGETLADKFENAKKIIGDYFKQLSGAMKEKDEAVGQVAGLTARAEKAEGERDTALGQVTSLTTERDGLKTQVTGLTTERDTARSRITLIESFCKHSNVDLAGLEKFQAVKTAEGLNGPEGESSEGAKLYKEWRDLKSKDGKKATAFFRKHKPALEEYRQSLG